MGNSSSRRKAKSKASEVDHPQDPPTLPPTPPPTPPPPTPQEVERSFFSSIDQVLDRKKQEVDLANQRFLTNFGQELSTILSFLQKPENEPFPRVSYDYPNYWTIVQYRQGSGENLTWDTTTKVFSNPFPEGKPRIMILYRILGFKDELKEAMERKAREVLPEFCEVKGLTYRIKVSVDPDSKKVIFEPYSQT